MKTCNIIKGMILLAALLLFVNVGFAENIDPDNDGSQYAYGANVGWLNFEPSEGPGVHVSKTQLTGYVWAENIGWISLSCENTSSCGTVNYGVTNDGAGNLGGYAWGQNVGWVNFNPKVAGDANHYGVTIDSEGNFAGWAYGENIGWINFNSAQLFNYNVKVCKVNFVDLGNFVDDWLQSGAGLPGDLSGNNQVDFKDYTEFAELWLDYCPDEWPLK